MYIKLFARTKNRDEALQIFCDATSSLANEIKEQNIIKTEPYWKIEEIYVIKADTKLYNTLTNEQLKKLWNSISDKWTFYGNPVDEALASLTTEGCNYILKGIYMINILL